MQAIVDGAEAPFDDARSIDAIAEGAISALSLAVERRNDALVARLIEAGADVDVRAAGDRTMVDIAPTPGIAERLVAAGARPQKLATIIDRPAVVACVVDHPWLPHGARAEAFVAACAAGSRAVAELVWEPDAVSAGLAAAARADRPAIIRWLFERGATHSYDLKEEYAPLMHAAGAGALEAAKVLIELGANVDAQTEWFVTALGLARRRGDTNMAGLLLAHGATDTPGEPVHVVMPYATYSNVLPVAPPQRDVHPCAQPDPWVLVDALAAGMPADTQDYSRPIAHAVYAGRARHVELLLAAGVDGSALIESAAKIGYLRCLERLLDQTPSALDAAFVDAAEHPRILRALLARGANVDARDRSGNTILHNGAWSRRTAIDFHLAIASHHLETRGRLGWTPLHDAVQVGNVAAIRTLLAAGANRGARDDDGRTPLELAHDPAVRAAFD